MSVQDVVARRQMDSLHAARERIKEVASLSVTAIISPGRLARMTGEEDQVVQLRAKDSTAIEFEVKRGANAFDGASQISISDLLSKSLNDLELGSLRVPGNGAVAKKISNAMHLMAMKPDVSIPQALAISEENPNLTEFSLPGLVNIVEEFKNRSVDAPSTSGPDEAIRPTLR
ncbi:MAG: hypothetical protein CBC55_03625 [Gammaproteobacteria bacterium TMED95]|nr:MAG: hypothetical protein CBC55_03625 [Gammaproteobacteria bacterium TMED95]|tara:strand:- start:2501 stop:3019 length:519 start_codon:yes stop_codon:yes gene_type:complete